MLRTTGALIATVAFLALYAVLRRWVLPGSAHVAANVLAIGALVLLARAAGMTRDELGLANWSAGARLGGLAFAVIAAVAIVAAAWPVTRSYFESDEADVSFGAMLVRALVVIPIATVVLEELAFRGVLLGLLRRDGSTLIAVALSAALFAVWHVPPMLGRDSAPAIAGTVAVTAVAGLAFGWLRVRSGSLLAPALAHTATNSVVFALAWVVTRSS